MTDPAPRPRTVTYASRILYAYAGLGVLNLPVAMAVFGLGYLVLGILGVGFVVAVAYFFARRPAWYEPVDLAFLTLGGALLLTAAVLLLQPSARSFFRKVSVA